MIDLRRLCAAWLSLALTVMKLALSPASLQPVQVATTSDFKRAMTSGAQHISIIDHLDLRGPTRLGAGGLVLGAVRASSTLRSLRVRSQRSVRTP
jgi:hypothetical protein